MSSYNQVALPVGTDINGFLIQKILGAGNFGITYQALNLGNNEKVALKEFIPRDIATRDEAGRVALLSEDSAMFYQWGMDRFVTEAQILAQFDHPNIIRVVSYFHANSTAYFAMDYVAGQSLDQLLRDEGAPDEDTLLKVWLIPLLHGLKEVHEKNYLHRDIKPANILVTDAGVPRLIDFGAACFAMGEEIRRTGDIVTPAYAPVEQYGTDHPLGPWSDLYALGATLYRCLVGKAPLPSTRRANAIYGGEADPLASISSLVGDKYSGELLGIIEWMLRVPSSERPQEVGEVLTALGAPLESTEARLSKVELRQALAKEEALTKKTDAKINYKFFLVGSKGGGKTTAINRLSDRKSDSVDHPMDGDSEGSVTVAMDFGVMELSSNERLNLCAAPGAAENDFMLDVLKQGATGMIVLMDNRAENVLSELQEHLNKYSEFVDSNRFAIGVTHMDQAAQPGIEKYQERISSIARDRDLSLYPPIFAVDARITQDLQKLVQALFLTAGTGK